MNVGDILLILLFVFGNVVLWKAYFHMSKMSYDVGISNDPYRLPVFLLTMLVTISSLLVLSDIIFNWAGE